MKVTTELAMESKKNDKIVTIAGDTERPKRRRLRVGDPDFVPPDGGWGWFIVFACGFSNLSTFPMFQQFGLLFRDKFSALDISNAETTTIINLNSAFNACVGLLNGPLFRMFSYRKVACFGGTLVAVSLFLTTFCSSFWSYLILYSIFYGSGIGITQSANALALNTYFKNKRRIATGFSWSTTALGPIVWPHIINALVDIYGMEGTLMIFSAFSGHAIMCSLLLQPVHWHTEFKQFKPEMDSLEKDSESGYFEEKLSKAKARSVFSSQYLFNETAYDITNPGTPMVIHANDGWYSQNRSLAGSTQNSRGVSTRPSYANLSEAKSKKSSYSNLADAKSKRNSSVNLAQEGKDRKEVKERKRKISQTKPTIQESTAEDCPTQKAPQDLKEEEKLLLLKVPEPNGYPNEKDVLKTAAKKLEEYKHFQEHEERELEKSDQKPLTFFDKVMIFFDFNLLKDPVYLNLMLGITIANFAELNFSILTPFVLKEFGFENYQVATFMSLLGAMDILVRFTIPFVADKIGWENRTFFLVGVLLMALGRIILVHTQTFYVSLVVAVIIGFGKGLRTIFIALVIPGYVPLERLPAASGLQLATSGILFLALGPVVGWIRDLVNDYVITLHLLNVMTYITAITWTIEGILNKRRKAKEIENSNS